MINTGKCPNDELRIRGVYDFTVKDEHLDAILEALSKPNNVRSIFLESNLSATGIQKVAQFLENNPQIESFDLWNASFSFQKPNDNIGYFTPVIQKNTTLKRLHLSGIGAANADTSQFFEAFKNNHAIECLSLYDNYFQSTDVAQQIAGVISTNTTLKSLKLGGHRFKAEELGIIAGSLPSNTVLEELDVSGNFTVKDESAILFANELAKNIHLKSIKLFSSEITALGAVALANSLLTNSHLIKLDLGCDSIGKEGTLALANALKTNHTLQELTIGVYSANNEGQYGETFLPQAT